MGRLRLCIMSLSLVLASVVSFNTASAAVIASNPSSQTVEVGDAFTVDLVLEVQALEQVSVFEGHFDISPTTVATFDDFTAGPSWLFVDAAEFAGALIVSAISDNAGGNRLVASLEFTAVAAGTFELLFSDFSFAERDLFTFPFFEEIDLTNMTGSAITSVRILEATITTVPNGSTISLLLIGGFIFVGNRFKQHS